MQVAQLEDTQRRIWQELALGQRRLGQMTHDAHDDIVQAVQRVAADRHQTAAAARPPDPHSIDRPELSRGPERPERPAPIEVGEVKAMNQRLFEAQSKLLRSRSPTSR